MKWFNLSMAAVNLAFALAAPQPFAWVNAIVALICWGVFVAMQTHDTLEWAFGENAKA